MKIQLNKAHFPVTTLGPGRRIGLWFQGCSIGCKGCVSQDTWGADNEKTVELDRIVDWCRGVADGVPDGITITGGEPFEQPVALLALLHALHAWRRALRSPFDILCYSGFSYKRIKRDHGTILANLDAIIPGPYVQAKGVGSEIWRGSSNQPLIALSELGAERYEGAQQHCCGSTDRLQVHVSEEAVWLIGIPKSQDMEHLEQAIKGRGVNLRRVSWRA